MKFVQLVRKEHLLGPLRRGFEAKRWDAEYARLGEDAQDHGLHHAGLLIHQRANELRSHVRFTHSTELTATTRLRTLVAMTNHFAVQTVKWTQERLAKVEATDEPRTQLDLLTLRLPLAVGADFSPDEILQGIVDGCQVSIRAAFESAGLLDGSAKFTAVNWSDVSSDLNLGILYRHLESLWDDCLWNGYAPSDSTVNAHIRFTTDDAEWQRRLAASQLRYASLATGFLMMVHSAHDRGELPELGRLARLRKARAIRKVGRKQVIVFAPESAEDGSNDEAAIIRLYAAEIFYRDLLREVQPALGGATVDDLLGAWMAVTQIGQLMRAPLQSIAEEKRPPHAWLPGYAPLLQRSAIVTAISKALSLDAAPADAIVEFLTYKGKATQELWAQPLVPASDAALMPVFAALTAQPSRLLDIWLRQLGVDLSRRGPAFEEHVRSELAHMISDSNLRSLAAVLTKALVFNPPRGRPEEIDVLLQVGDVVVIGEAKCALLPAETKQVARHRDLLTKGAAQVARKAAAVATYKDEFRALLQVHGLNPSETFRIVPAVIVNSAIHTGFPIDGVPIVDLYILRVFFEGQITDTVIESGKADRDVRTQRIYQSAAEAPHVLETYLNAPPQLATYANGLRERWIPIGKMSSADADWSFLGFESMPDVSAFSVTAGGA